MADVKWIKIATEIFDNKKIRLIESMPEGDALIVVWFKLLMLAGKTNDGGMVYFTKDIPFTDQMLSTYFNKPITTIQLALNTFQKFGMIDIVDELIHVSNWEEYQNVDGMDKIREQNRLRKQKQRENERLLLEKDTTCHVTGHVTVTRGHATDKDIDKDIERDKKNIYIAHFEEAWKIYPKKKDKSRAFQCYMARINSGYSENELLTATKNYAAECEKEGRPEKYIKNGSTFFGINEPFVDYLGERKTTPVGILDYEIENYHIHPQEPPFYGFPEEWFENYQPIRDRFVTIRQKKDPSVGITDELIFKPDELWNKYLLRKQGYETMQKGEFDI